jgi:hypothetical protein
MSKRTGLLIVSAVVLIAVIAAVSAFFFTSGDNAKAPEIAAIGPSPTLPEPTKTPLPTVHIAPAKGWAGGGATNGSERTCGAFATGLSHPRLDR